jgi:LmbE family N-acetylglucosaminyl deacetylase
VVATALAPSSGSLEFLRTYERVYLSPHYDDVCFSLGAMARALGGGTLISLFTRSLYIANAEIGAQKVWSQEKVTALRDAEDAHFADACGLQRMSLGLDEPALRGRRPHGPGIDEDRVQLKAPLSRMLETLPKPGARPIALFCPAAIGGHVNHVATLLTVLELLPSIERRYRCFFYEDLFYASSYGRRIAGLIRLRLRVGPRRRAVRHVHRIDQPESKLALVACYTSQHRRPPTIDRFSPATFPPSPAHEAFWEFV